MTQKERDEKIKYILDSGLSSYRDTQGVLGKKDAVFKIIEIGTYKPMPGSDIGNMYLWPAVEDHFLDIIYIQALRESAHYAWIGIRDAMYRLKGMKNKIIAERQPGYTDRYKIHCSKVIKSFTERIFDFLVSYVSTKSHSRSVENNRAVIDHKADGTCDVYIAGELLEGGAGITHQEAKELLTDAGYKMGDRNA